MIKTRKIVTLTRQDVAILLKEENLLKFNRKVSKNHILKMKSSIEKLGVLRLPVLAKLLFNNGELAIADMQHGLFAWYEISEDNDVIDAIVVDCKTRKSVVDLISKLNTTSKGWKDKDYLECWLEFGAEENTNHHYYTALQSRYSATGLSLGLLIDIYTKSKKNFKDGNLVFNHPEKSHKVSNFCTKFREKGFPSFQLTGMAQFLLKNDLSPREEKSFSKRIDKLHKKGKLPRHRDDFRNMLNCIFIESEEVFKERLA